MHFSLREHCAIYLLDFTCFVVISEINYYTSSVGCVAYNLNFWGVFWTLRSKILKWANGIQSTLNQQRQKKWFWLVRFSSTQYFGVGVVGKTVTHLTILIFICTAANIIDFIHVWRQWKLIEFRFGWCFKFQSC